MASMLIRAARVFDGSRAQPMAPGFVGIDGGRIRAVGHSAELGASGADTYAQVRDLGDATLLPGLINMHTHMSFSADDRVLHNAVNDSPATRMIRSVANLQTALACGVTTVRDCGTLPDIALPLRDAVEAGLLQAPRIIASGAVTTTGGHCWYCAREADDEASVRQAVRAHFKDGVDFIKLFATGGNLTPGSNPLAAQFTAQELCAAADEARRLGLRTASHALGTEGVRYSVRARVTTIEHCTFHGPSGIGWDDDLVRCIADAGIVVCPTVFRGVTRFLDDEGFEPTPAQQAAVAIARDRLALTRRLADAGVRLVAGNDAGVTWSGFDDYAADLLLTAEGCGFSALEVLRQATSEAARALGRDDIGVLRPGAAADVLAVAGDALADLRTLARPLLVVARGQPVPLR